MDSPSSSPISLGIPASIEITDCIVGYAQPNRLVVQDQLNQVCYGIKRESELKVNNKTVEDKPFVKVFIGDTVRILNGSTSGATTLRGDTYTTYGVKDNGELWFFAELESSNIIIPIPKFPEPVFFSYKGTTWVRRSDSGYVVRVISQEIRGSGLSTNLELCVRSSKGSEFRIKERNLVGGYVRILEEHG